MKHLTYANKSLLVGDEVADLLLQYSARLASSGSADTVEVHAIGSDGNDVTATFLLGEGAPLMAETSTTQLPEPDNTVAVQQITDGMSRITPTAIESDTDAGTAALDDLYYENE
jgi:hypothetical protein